MLQYTTMAGEGTSDQRIGENLIKNVIQEQLEDVSPELVPPLVLSSGIQGVENEQEKKIVTQLGGMIKIIGDRLTEDQELNDVIDGLVGLGNKANQINYQKIVEQVFDDGQITWGRIAVLFFVAGRMAVKMVKARLPQSVIDILKWTVEYFRNTLLGWVRAHGGWINSFSDLARCQVERVAAMSPQTSACVFFIVGIALGSLITWTLARRT